MRRSIAVLAGFLAGFWLPAGALAQEVGEGGGMVIPPEVAVGWVADTSDGSWSLQRQTSTSVAKWQISGWWLEACTGLRLGPSSDLLLAGGWFLAQPAAGVWHTHPSPLVVAFEVPSYQWGTVDVLFRYRTRQGRFDVLSGVRWDKKKARVHFSDNTDDDYSLDTYAPILGFQMNQPLAGGALSLRMLGSPLVLGQMKYAFRDNQGFEEYGHFPLRHGYMVECRAQYSHAVRSRLRLGGFVQWGIQRVQSKEAALAGMTTERVAWRVTNHAWLLGVTASLNHRNP